MENLKEAEVILRPDTDLVEYNGSIITWAEYIEIRDSF